MHVVCDFYREGHKFIEYSVCGYLIQDIQDIQDIQNIQDIQDGFRPLRESSSFLVSNSSPRLFSTLHDKDHGCYSDW